MLWNLPPCISFEMYSIRGIAHGRLGMPRVRTNHDCREHGHQVRNCTLNVFYGIIDSILLHIYRSDFLWSFIFKIRSRAMRLLSVDQLCTLLKHALTRMRNVSNVDPFTRPVDPSDFPAYKDYVTCPMDMLTIEKNVKRKQ